MLSTLGWYIGVLSVMAVSAHAELIITFGPSRIELDQFQEIAFLDIADSNGGAIKFQYTKQGEQPGLSEFLVILPSSGVTPARVLIGLNALKVGMLVQGVTYNGSVAFATVDEAQPSTVGRLVVVRLPSAARPTIRAVVNAASGQSALAPGMLVSVVGENLAGSASAIPYGTDGRFPTTYASTTLSINGVPAPLRYVSPGLIQAVVPDSLMPGGNGEVVVRRSQSTSGPYTVPIRGAVPGVFTSEQPCCPLGPTGIRQVGLNTGYSSNAADSPARVGDAFEIYMTGAGPWTPAPGTDSFLVGTVFRTQPVSVTIGGVTTQILYVGTGGAERVWSTLQINVLVPPGLSAGAQQLVVRVGDGDNAAQKATVWVQ